MADRQCFLCKSKIGRFEPAEELDGLTPQLLLCEQCCGNLTVVKMSRGKSEPSGAGLYEQGVENLVRLVEANGVGEDEQGRIDAALGFPMLGERLDSLRKTAQEKAERELQMREALSSMLITSGFSFEGYRITKYSGYISGDDVTTVERGLNWIVGGGTDAGEALSKSLVKIRRNALHELKVAAYDLGCNAVIGVDFDYITLEPETANIAGGTTYMPYVFCVTANGNAVVIEKIGE